MSRYHLRLTLALLTFLGFAQFAVAQNPTIMISTGYPKAAGKGQIEVKGTITLAGNWKYADQTPKVNVRAWIPGSYLSEYKITVDTTKNPHEFSGKLANLAPGTSHYVTAEIRLQVVTIHTFVSAPKSSLSGK